MSTMISFRLLKKYNGKPCHSYKSKTLVFEKDPHKPGVYKEIDGSYWDISLVIKSKSIVIAERHLDKDKNGKFIFPKEIRSTEVLDYLGYYPHNYILAEAFLENPEEEEDKEKLMNEYCDAVLGACGL